jgi:hypothetical protein
MGKLTSQYVALNKYREVYWLFTSVKSVRELVVLKQYPHIAQKTYTLASNDGKLHLQRSSPY